ncbi:MAG: hypothetical protein HDR21_15165 [Lachnospiraceae bacterium]|nr:hypothetical protein [Lachnospiraceae bacterium]
MKPRMKVLLATLGVSLAVCFLQPVPTVMASEQSSSITQYDNAIEPQSDALRWIYKVEDGKVYKRLYNASTREWIGGWIYVGEYQP